MDGKLASVAAVSLSVIACGLGVLALSRESNERVSAGTVDAAADPNAERIRELTRGMAELRVDIDRLTNARLETPASRAPAASAAQSTAVPPEILERLKRLEDSLSALQRQSKDRVRNAEPPKSDALDVDETYRLASDPSASEQQKLAALRALRSRLGTAQDARSRDAILSVLELAERSKDENTRTDVYRNLHGVPDPAVRDSMLRALSSDPSAKVRAKVAEDIDKFLPDSIVEGALRQTANNDPDDGVRGAALKTLAKK